MKKSYLKLIFASLLILSLAFSILPFIKTVSAADVPSPEGVISQQTGVDVNQIPATPEQIKEEITNYYLKQEWGKIITNKPIIGPIHNFLTAHPLPFQILFAEPYTLSPTLLIVIVLWLFFALKSAKIIESSGIINKNFAIPIGFGIAIILAQIHLLRLIVNSTYLLIFSREAWWERLILIFVALGLFGTLYYLSDYFSKYLEEAKKAKELGEMKKGIKESKAFIKGVEEGEELFEGGGGI